MPFLALLRCHSWHCSDALPGTTQMPFLALLRYHSWHCSDAIPSTAQIPFLALLRCSSWHCSDALPGTAQMPSLALVGCHSWHCSCVFPGIRVSFFALLFEQISKLNFCIHYETIVIEKYIERNYDADNISLGIGSLLVHWRCIASIYRPISRVF